MIQSPEILKVLETAPLFRGITHKLLARHLSQARLRVLNSGETLLTAGQANDVVYIILSGRLSIQSKDTQVDPIAMLGEGECVGEMSVLGDAQVSAYVIAATNCKLLAIDHNALWRLIDSSHEAAHNMLNILTRRIRVTDQLLTENLELHHGFSAALIVDELTGLYNRHWMHDKFDRHLQRSLLSNKPGCLMMLEMDHFKSFSDSYGQLGSDQALRNIAHTMLSCLRPDDQAAHYLGEQFAVFLPNTPLLDACTAAERLRVAVSQSMVMLPSGDALPSISISLGLAQAQPGDTLDSLFARAGNALQLAKESGGNCIQSNI